MLFPRSIQVAKLLWAIADEWAVSLVCADQAQPAAESDMKLVALYSRPEIASWRVPLDPSEQSLFETLRHPPRGRRVESPDRRWMRRALQRARKFLAHAPHQALVTFAQPWVDHLIGLELKRATGLPWVAHFSDPWAQNPFNNGLPARVRQSMYGNETQVVYAADTLVFVNRETLELTMSRYPTELARKAVVLPHAFDPRAFSELTPYRQDHKRFRVSYVGNFYQERDPGRLLRALDILNRRPGGRGDMDVRLVGRGAAGIMGEARRMGLDESLVCVGPVGYQASLEELAHSDLNLIIDAPFPRSPFFPSKLVDYFGAGRPILGIVPLDGCSARLLRQAECPVIAPEDPEAIADALASLHQRWRQGDLRISPEFERVRQDFQLSLVGRRFNLVLNETILRSRDNKTISTPPAVVAAPPPPRVAFVSLYCSPLFTAEGNGLFGGSEVRAWLLAIGLARHADLDVSVIVFNHGQGGPVTYGATTLIPHPFYHADRGSTLAFHLPRLLARAFRIIERGLRKARSLARRRVIDRRAFSSRAVDGLAVAEADVYCVFGMNNLAAEVAAYCRSSGKKMILLAGSDINFSEDYYERSKLVDGYGVVGDLAWYSAMTADVIVVQTEQQARLCKERYNRASIVMTNPVALGNADRRASYAAAAPAVWIGKSDRTKQPDVLLELARRVPDLPFVLVMNRSHPDLHEEILRSCPPNVRCIERLSLAEADRLIESARLLVNTSRFEGFPNTFLQAGRAGVPIVSLKVDPDGFIVKSGCGGCAEGDLDRMVDLVNRIAFQPDVWARMSGNIRSYVERQHSLDEKVGQLRTVIDQLLSVKE